MSLSFRKYLSNRGTRYGPGSEILKSLISDQEFAAIATRVELDAYLKRRKIPANGQIYAHQVWHTYLAAKKRHAQAVS